MASRYDDRNVDAVLDECYVDVYDLQRKAYCLPILNCDDVGENFRSCRQMAQAFAAKFSFEPSLIVFVYERGVRNPAVISVSLYFTDRHYPRPILTKPSPTPHPDNSYP